MIKRTLEIGIPISLYMAIAIYTIIQKNSAIIVAADIKMFTGITIAFFLFGLVSFFHFERYVQVTGLIIMLLTIFCTIFFLFL